MSADEISSIFDISVKAIIIIKILYTIFKIVVGIAILYIACNISKILDILRDLHYYQRNHFESEFEVEEDEEKESLLTKIINKLDR